MRIGVIAVQGDFAEHAEVLQAAGFTPQLVKGSRDLSGVEGLVFPGGESTTQAKLIDSAGLRAPLEGLIRDGMPVLGTCAGLIMLSRAISGGRPDQWSFDLLDVAVLRNGFGRQVRSFEADLPVKGLPATIRAVFIRAPVIVSAGEAVEVLAEVSYKFVDGTRRVLPVVVRQGNVLAAAFHPELVGDGRLHSMAFGAAFSRLL